MNVEGQYKKEDKKTKRDRGEQTTEKRDIWGETGNKEEHNQRKG